MSAKSSKSTNSASVQEISDLSDDLSSMFEKKFFQVENKSDMPSVNSKKQFVLRIFDENMKDGKKGKRIQIYHDNKLMGDLMLPRNDWKKLKQHQLKYLDKKAKEAQKSPEKMNELIQTAGDVKEKDIPVTIEQNAEQKLKNEKTVVSTIGWIAGTLAALSLFVWGAVSEDWFGHNFADEISTNLEILPNLLGNDLEQQGDLPATVFGLAAAASIYRVNAINTQLENNKTQSQKKGGKRRNTRKHK